MKIQFESIIYGEDKYRGEVEIPVEVEAIVKAEPDAYGTGDSPTMYEVELKSVINSDGEDIVNKLDNYYIEILEEEAIKEVA